MKRLAGAERHNINISIQVWGELKHRALLERTTASELAAYAVEKIIENGQTKIELPGRYQSRDSDESKQGRTVFFAPEIWARTEELASRNDVSVSGVIDFALKQYLGIGGSENTDEVGESKIDPANIVQVGDAQVYLGENPITIDLQRGPDKPQL